MRDEASKSSEPNDWTNEFAFTLTLGTESRYEFVRARSPASHLVLRAESCREANPAIQRDPTHKLGMRKCRVHHESPIFLGLVDPPRGGRVDDTGQKLPNSYLTSSVAYLSTETRRPSARHKRPIGADSRHHFRLEPDCCYATPQVRQDTFSEMMLTPNTKHDLQVGPLSELGQRRFRQKS